MANRVQVLGKVVEQVNMPYYRLVDHTVKAFDEFRPKIAYEAAGANYTFVDKASTLPIGALVPVLYTKADPRQAVRSTNWVWLKDANVLPICIISAFFFCVIFISITDYGKQRVIVPGELDGFRTDKVSGSYTG